MAATNKRGIFALLDVRERQGAGVWSTRGDVWLSPSPFFDDPSLPLGFDTAYFTGGAYPEISTVDRIDYSNDTATALLKGPLSAARYDHAGTGNQNFGYHGGGRPSPHNQVERIDYGNDTPTMVVKGPLSGTTYSSSTTGNQDFGYFCGGFSTVSRVSRIDYSNDTATASPKGPLSVGRGTTGSTSNQNFGYIAGGTPGYLSLIDRIDYSNDSATAVAKGPLNNGKYRLAGTGNADFGYLAGGGAPSVPDAGTTVERIDYSNDTATASPKGQLNNSHSLFAATGNQSFGYFAGGFPSSSTKIDRIDYSNDTATALDKGLLTDGRFQLSASSSKDNGNPVKILNPASSVRPNVAPQGTDFGYFGGGDSPSKSIVDRIDYSNDTATASVRGPLSVDRRQFAATGNGSFGYFAGGFGTSGLSSVDRVDYSNDTATASPKGPLAAVRYDLAATGNQSFGYFAGMWVTSEVVYRIDYSNDTATASRRGDLNMGSPSGFSRGAATGNSNFGYFGGSYPNRSSVNRIDYSNDSVEASPKGPLSVARDELGATGNASFGYFGGGHNGSSNVTIVDRIDYSNDTATASPKGDLSVAKNFLAATGNTDFGYFGGGVFGGGSIVNRVDYSNDTGAAPARGPLSRDHGYLAAASSRENALPLKGPGNLEVPVSFSSFSLIGSTPVGTDFGYFGGGSYPSVSDYKSTVDRIDFNNDTATASPKGNLSRTTQNHGGASSNTGGYFFGRFPAASTVDRIDYSNDTATASPKGKLSVARGYTASTGNNDFGYTGGGSAPGAVSTVDRLDYSNDTANAVGKGPLSLARSALTSTGNQSFGYFIGGSSPNVTLVDRIDYGNDTATASPKGNLSTNNYYNPTATGNANFGYVAVGNFPSSSKIDRIDYSNDTATATPKGPLASATVYRGATGNSNFGYFSGGQYPSTVVHSTISRIDYSNDTATASPKGNLSIAKNKHAGVSSREAGLPTQVETTVNYPVGTYATPHFGYFAGGTPGPKSTVDRIDYSNDTVAAVAKGSLPPNTQRERGGGTSSGTHGYFAAGLTPASPSSTIVDRVDYVNDTVTLSNKGPLSLSRNAVASVGNANFGYFIGGGSINSPYIYSSMDRVDYSNDTATASIKGQMTGNRTSAAATGNQDFGYIGGGSNTGGSNVDRMDYANDTATALAKGDLSVARSGFLSAAGNASFGYFGGGPSLSSVDRVDYSNDTATASPKGSFTINRYGSAGTGDANFGYFGGGSPGPVSSIDRIDYSNDTATASPKGPLSAARHYLSGTSARENGFVPIGPSVVANTTVQTGLQHVRGYIFGGSGDPSVSPSTNQPTQRIDFTNDTATAVVRGAPAGSSLYYNFAVGNRNYAYAANLGNPSPASVQRFDYSNETAALVFRGAYNTVLIGAGGPTSSVGGYNASATGNHDYGWTNGGYKLYSVPAPSGYYESFSQIDRIDYSNDTANASRRSYTTNRFGVGSATGTNSYGYWIGGSTSMPSYSGTSTKVDRTDYASDTTNAVAKGNLTAVHGQASDSIGNSSYAWVAGGRPYDSTKVDRIDYTNDTATASPKGNLSVAVYGQASTGSQSYGYFCGSVPATSRVDRIDYSNDTATASPKGPLVYQNKNSSGASTTYNSLPST